MHITYRKKIISCFLIFLLLVSALPGDTASISASRQMKLNVPKTKTLQAGARYKLKVKYLPKNASRIHYKWTSSKKKVATISKKGMVKAKSTGSTKITCNISYTIKTGNTKAQKHKKLSCTIKVKKKGNPSSPTITPDHAGISDPDTSASPAAGISDPAISASPAEGSPENPDTIGTFATLTEYVKDMGIGINLGNTMEAYWEDKNNKTSGAMTIGSNVPAAYETCWGAVVTTQEIIDGYKNAGFSTVRIPVYWGNMMKDDGTFTINENYMQRIEEIIGYCLKDNLYAVINIHHYDEFLIKNYSKDKVIQITEKLWTQIAEHFKDYSDHLVFEGFNENLGTQREKDNYTEEEIYDYVNEMNQTFVDTVRKSGGNNTGRILIVSGYWTNIDKTTDTKFKMPSDSTADRLMVSVHYIDNSMYWSNKIGGKEWLSYSKAQCELLKKAFTDKGIPVFVGECTATYDKERFASDATYKSSSECLQILLNTATDYDFLPVLWDVNDGAYSRTSYCMKSQSDQEVITKIAQKIRG